MKKDSEKLLLALAPLVVLGILSASAVIACGVLDNLVGLYFFLYSGLLSGLSLCAIVGQSIEQFEIDLYHPQVRYPALAAFLFFIIGTVMLCLK